VVDDGGFYSNLSVTELKHELVVEIAVESSAPESAAYIIFTLIAEDVDALVGHHSILALRHYALVLQSDEKVVIEVMLADAWTFQKNIILVVDTIDECTI
jgi:hypothetical protein